MRSTPSKTQQILGAALVVHGPHLRQKARAALLKGGDRRAFDVEEMSHDLLQCLAVEALQHADRYDLRTAPFPWLCGILRNLVLQARDQHRRRPLDGSPRQMKDAQERTKEQALQRHQAGPWRLWEPGDPEILVAGAEWWACVLSGLDADDREVIRLSVLEDYEGAQLAAALGISPMAARTRKCRALVRARKVVKALTAEQVDHAA